MRPQPLPPDELAAFWAIGCPLEANFVDDAELVRAGAEGRVQYASFYSVMGTAETGWCRSALEPGEDRAGYAIVPRGELAEDWEYDQFRDDRDVDGCCGRRSGPASTRLSGGRSVPPQQRS